MRSGVLTYRSDLSVCMRKRSRRHKLLPRRSPYVTFVCCWCCNSRCHGTALHLTRNGNSRFLFSCRNPMEMGVDTVYFGN